MISMVRLNLTNKIQAIHKVIYRRFKLGHDITVELERLYEIFGTIINE